MKNDNFCGFGSIDEYVRHKLSSYEKEEKNFETLFRYMFCDADNVMVETSDGYRIKKVTYGEFRDSILSIAPTLMDSLDDLPGDAIVGLYMQNSVEWLKLFWSILICGYRPLLMNTRLPDDVLEGIITDHSVSAVISDGKRFSVKTLVSAEVSVPSDKAHVERPFGSEVIFMSSGTSSKVKLCAYTGENFYYQIRDSVNIIEQCPAIKQHYDGAIKHLALLPLYHVFGFIAVYMWFGFFSRTFVFPKDLDPQTIRSTVKKHKVTHLFAVPMVWEAVYKAAVKKIKAKGKWTWRKFRIITGLVNSLGPLGDRLAHRALGEVRDALFGDSIRFLISGGSHIDPDALKFFNGIGYHLANGYGMTEVGITSVEKSNRKKMLNSASIGSSFGNTEYSVGEGGVLLVRGRTMASRIVADGVSRQTDFDEWFETGDLVRKSGGRYFVEGRADDLIITENGENLNPNLIENSMVLPSVDGVCIFADENKSVVLLASVQGCFSSEKFREIHGSICEQLAKVKLDVVIKKIVFTPEPLMLGNEFKVSRKKLASRYLSGKMKIFDLANIDENISEMMSGLEAEIRDCFAEALGKGSSEIGENDNFFRDLGGTSIDYFSLLGLLKNRFGLELPADAAERLATVKEFSHHIKTH